MRKKPKKNEQFGVVTEQDLHSIDEEAYSHWGQGLSFNEFREENREEEKRGVRYVLRDLDNTVLCSLILFPRMIKTHKAFGISSVITSRSARNKGHAHTLLKKVMEEVRDSDPGTIFVCHSEISPNFYISLGFKQLPKILQKYGPTIGMIQCTETQWNEILGYNYTDVKLFF